MDIATIVGTLLGFVVVVGAIVMGGGAAMFFHVPSLCITIGGMLCATMIHFSLPQFLSIFSIVKKTLIAKIPAQSELVQKMVNFAAINRRDGSMALEPEIQYLQERHAGGKKILEFMGASAPAFGMIGTLIGLVQMLRNLSTPDQIGQGMAVALLTTFYGAFAANLVFIPLAGKLGIYSKEESLAMEMVLEGVCSIALGDNPTIVRERMQAFVSHSRRKEIKATV